MPFTGEVLRFDLAAFRSTVTRQMLQVRLRMTAQAFGSGTDLVAANLTPDGGAVEVDAAALMGANARVRAGLDDGPEAALSQVGAIGAARASLDGSASAFAARVRAGGHPARRSVVAYVRACAVFQALGALKFCLPETLRPRLAAWLDDPATVDALLAPEGPSLWSVMTARELALARMRLQGPSASYRRRLAEHRRAFGYLHAEDVDFRAHETIEAIDARLATLGAGGMATLDGERRRLAQAQRRDRERKARAREVFAERLASSENTGGIATFVAQVLLARALASHEDLNRRAKMRFLRDLRDLAAISGLDVARTGLAEFLGACVASGRSRPVLRSP